MHSFTEHCFIYQPDGSSTWMAFGAEDLAKLIKRHVLGQECHHPIRGWDYYDEEIGRRFYVSYCSTCRDYTLYQMPLSPASNPEES